MRKLSKARGAVEVEADYFDRGANRAIVMVSEPRCLVLRLKRSRQTYRMTWAKLFQYMVEASCTTIPRVKRGGLNGVK
jgi:hypothetical protein